MIGIILLAHNNLGRVTELARYLSDQGCAVVLHVDKTAKGEEFTGLEAALGGIETIVFSPRVACEWGRFSLVEAVLGAAETMFAHFPDVSHVALISGSCLPIKPIPDLVAYLQAEPDADFIEAVPVRWDKWVVDGLSTERFTLYFPFSWQRQRWLFDKAVDLQRRFRIKRKMPDGLEPHIGQQWWCLTRETLQRILQDPHLPAYKTFFRLTWIPDESFFQSLTRKHARKIIEKPLTFVKFDSQGKPFTFYDDHLDLLRKSEWFFARKIWPGAAGLYKALLDAMAQQPEGGAGNSDPLHKVVRRSVNLRSRGRPGLINQNRYTSRWYEQVFATARPYYIFDGFDQVLPGFLAAMRENEPFEMHGHLFARDRVEYVGGEAAFAGNLTSGARMRDYRPDQFLVNLIWGRRMATQAFLHDCTLPGQLKRHIFADPNAQIFRIRDAWMLDAMRKGCGDPAREALYFGLYLHQAESLLADLDAWEFEADYTEYSLADLLARPQTLAREMTAALPPDCIVMPALAAPVLPEGFPEFLDRMVQAGFDIPSLPAIQAYRAKLAAE